MLGISFFFSSSRNFGPQKLRKNMGNYYLFCAVFVCATFGSVLLLGENTTSVPTTTSVPIERNNNNGCNVTIKSQYGYIKSPNYPNKYPRYARCYYMVERFSKDVCEVKLTFESFEVEKMTFTQCSEDFFEIQDGDKRQNLCGELPPGSKKFVFFPINSDQLLFKFSSTFHQKKGFSIEVKQLPFSCVTTDPNKAAMTVTRSSACTQTVDTRVGRINFPVDDYSTDTCTYTIRRSEPQACLVQLDFTSFDVFESAGCVTHHLLLPDGQKMCGILGGTRKYVPMENDEVVLKMVALEPGRHSHFDISVTQQPGPCEGVPQNVTGTTTTTTTTTFGGELNTLAHTVHD